MKILVVVDMQNDFITGSLGTPEAKAIVPNVKNKIEEAVANGDWIIYTRDTHFEDYLETREGRHLPVEHCVYQTNGWMIPQELLPPGNFENYKIIDKQTFGSFDLIESIASYGPVDDIEVVGLVADICVLSNAMLIKAAFYETTTVSVDSMCTAGTTIENYQSALNVMRSCQIEVI